MVKFAEQNINLSYGKLKQIKMKVYKFLAEQGDRRTLLYKKLDEEVNNIWKTKGKNSKEEKELFDMDLEDTIILLDDFEKCGANVKEELTKVI